MRVASGAITAAGSRGCEKNRVGEKPKSSRLGNGNVGQRLAKRGNRNSAEGENEDAESQNRKRHKTGENYDDPGGSLRQPIQPSWLSRGPSVSVQVL